MPYNEFLADRIKRLLLEQKVFFEAKKMMGGLAFMVNDKMCVGVIKDELMVRIDPEIYEASLQKPGCHIMDFTGRPMKGFVMVNAEGIDMDDDLAYWIGLALHFNPKAKSSKSKKKS
ncbi:MAG: TfoX/Sxy family protein [Bacteroidetes bacterium]|nr:TfoX/Sxy family protein [Bacteroidota bacterium]